MEKTLTQVGFDAAVAWTTSMGRTSPSQVQAGNSGRHLYRPSESVALVSATAQQLGPSLFATTYGPLQGCEFALGDFLDPLLPVNSLAGQRLFMHFGLKTYIPAYPKVLPTLAQTLGWQCPHTHQAGGS